MVARTTAAIAVALTLLASCPRIGPRLTTEPGFRRAARYVERRLGAQGYDVRRQQFPVPAGDSWGVSVEAGSSFNVVATPPGALVPVCHEVPGAARVRPRARDALLAGYHSAGDVPAVVSPRQLARTGRVIWAWLRPGRAS
jgi:hypothetical protein